MDHVVSLLGSGDPEVDMGRDLQRLALAFVVIAACDLLCQLVGWFPESKSNTRYFSLHVIINAYVTVVHFKVRPVGGLRRVKSESEERERLKKRGGTCEFARSNCWIRKER